MARFLRIGDELVNCDQILRVKSTGHEMEIVFVNGQSAQYTGAAAQQLRVWVESVTPETAQSVPAQEHRG